MPSRDDCCTLLFTTACISFVILLILSTLGLLGLNIWLAYYLETIFYDSNDFTGDFINTELGKVLIYIVIFLITNFFIDIGASILCLIVISLACLICFIISVLTDGGFDTCLNNPFKKTSYALYVSV